MTLVVRPYQESGYAKRMPGGYGSVFVSDDARDLLVCANRIVIKESFLRSERLCLDVQSEYDIIGVVKNVQTLECGKSQLVWSFVIIKEVVEDMISYGIKCYCFITQQSSVDFLWHMVRIATLSLPDEKYKL